MWKKLTFISRVGFSLSTLSRHISYNILAFYTSIYIVYSMRWLWTRVAPMYIYIVLVHRYSRSFFFCTTSKIHYSITRKKLKARRLVPRTDSNYTQHSSDKTDEMRWKILRRSHREIDWIETVFVWVFGASPFSFNIFIKLAFYKHLCDVGGAINFQNVEIVTFSFQLACH